MQCDRAKGMKTFLFCCVLPFPITGFADQPRVYLSEAGDSFVMTCTGDGYTLSLIPQGEKIYLGKSCDAMSTRFGGGTWCMSNGGLGVTVGNLDLIFPRQEPYCPGEGYSPFICGC